MLPFTIDRLIMDMNHNIIEISKDIIKWKYKFCCDFEKEMDLESSNYSETIFDYIFNLFYFKRAFKEGELKKYVEEFKDLDFQRPTMIYEYLNGKTENGFYHAGQYAKMIVLYKNCFMDYFGFMHEDQLYIQRKIDSNKINMREKLMEYMPHG